MRKSIERLLNFVCALALTGTIILSQTIPGHAAEKEGAVINIVYDDSGSMSGSSSRWSQAKYAVEIFSAMMGSTDIINVFPMSHYQRSSGATEDSNKYFTLKGNENGQQRVDELDKELNGYGSTPFAAVESAAAVLKKAQLSDKWLIILTDGAFDEPREYSMDLLEGYAASGMKVVFISIDIPANDPDTYSTLNDGQNFLAYNTNSNEVLHTVTTVAQQIFSLQQIPLSSQNPYTFSADIPLSKLIILAQGKKAEVKELKNGGEAVTQGYEKVKVSILDSTPYKPESDSKVADGLEGVVASYTASNPKKPMAPGTYTFEANATDVQVFFEPGVEIQAMLDVGNDFGTKNILEIDELSADGSTLSLKFVNPLSGEDIDPSSSALLQGADLYLTVTDENGNSKKYSDGEILSLDPGSYSLEAASKFPSKVTFSSGNKEVQIVTPIPLVRFSSNTGYSLSAADLSTDIPVEFFLMKKDGTGYSAEELKKLKVSMQGTPGIEWKVTESDEIGKYLAVPEYVSENGSAALQNDHMTAEVVVVDQKGDSYTYTTDINLNREIPVDLQLEVVLPDETIESNGKKYMFDSSTLGIGPDRPYLRVSVSVKNPDGSSRSLTEEEWQAGIDGFTFLGKQIDSGFLESLYRLCLKQSINFACEKGDDPSTYRLYLDGAMATRVLPGTLDVNITLTIPCNAGLIEKGTTQTTITVKPQTLWAYLGTAILFFILIVIAIFLIVSFVKKKRIPKKFDPHRIFITDKYKGVKKMDPVKERLSPTIEKHALNLWKPEEASFQVDLNPVKHDTIMVKVRAQDSTHVVLTNLADLEAKISNATLKGTKLNKIVKDNGKGFQPIIDIAGTRLKLFGPANHIEVSFSEPKKKLTKKFK